MDDAERTAEHTLELPVPSFPELDHDPDDAVTQEIPSIPVVPLVPLLPEMPVLPPHLINDPILTMDAPHLVHTPLFDHYYGRHPAMRPPRPTKGPRMPIRRGDHLLAAMAASVVVLGFASYAMVRSGWRSDMPQSRESVVPVVTREYPQGPEPSTQSYAAPAPSVLPSSPAVIAVPLSAPSAPSVSPGASPSPVEDSPEPTAPVQAPTTAPQPSSAPTPISTPVPTPTGGTGSPSPSESSSGVPSESVSPTPEPTSSGPIVITVP